MKIALLALRPREKNIGYNEREEMPKFLLFNFYKGGRTNGKGKQVSSRVDKRY